MSSGPLYFEPSGVVSSTIGSTGSSRIGKETTSSEADSSGQYWSLPEWLIWGGNSSQSSSKDAISSSSSRDGDNERPSDGDDDRPSVNDPQLYASIKSSIQAGFKMELTWDPSKVKKRKLEIRRIDDDDDQLERNTDIKYVQPSIDASNMYKNRATGSVFNDDINDDELDSLRLHPTEMVISTSRQASSISDSVSNKDIVDPRRISEEESTTDQPIIKTTASVISMESLRHAQLKMMMLWLKASAHRFIVHCKMMSFWMKVIMLQYWKRLQDKELYQSVINREEVLRIIHQASLVHATAINHMRFTAHASQPLLSHATSIIIYLQQLLSQYLRRYIRPQLHEVLRWLLARSSDIHDLVRLKMTETTDRRTYLLKTYVFVPFGTVLAFIRNPFMLTRNTETIMKMMLSNYSIGFSNNTRTASINDTKSTMTSINELNMFVEKNIKIGQTGFDGTSSEANNASSVPDSQQPAAAADNDHRHRHRQLKSKDSIRVMFMNIADDNTTLSVVAKIDVWVALNLPLQEDLSKALTLLPVKLLLSQAGSITASAVLKATTPRFIDLLLQDYYRRRDVLVAPPDTTIT